MTPSGLETAATCKIVELHDFKGPSEWRAVPLFHECIDCFLMSFKIWNTATVGGNIVMSLPAGAMISLTAALEGVCSLWPQNGKPREVPVVDFVTGMRTNVLQKGELVRSIFLPASALTKRFAMRQVSLTRLGRSAALIIATVGDDGYDFLLTISAATPRPVQGSRFEPPVPGIQDDYVAILRFDTEVNLKAWLESPVRKKLIAEAEPLTEEFHARLGTGFEQWFRDETTGSGPLSVWKMDMIVLLLLYPIVFLWGVWLGTPILQNAFHLPWAVNLFIGNIVSVVLTGFAVPWVANRMGWWMFPRGKVVQPDLLGAGLICAIYAISIWIFWKYF